MKTIRHYIDEAIDNGVVKNDKEIADRLQLNRSTISLWRSSKTAPNEDQAAALAELLGKPEIMAECGAARAETDKGRAVWERLARTLSMKTATQLVIMGCMTGLPALPSQNAQASENGVPAVTFCIM